MFAQTVVLLSSRSLTMVLGYRPMLLAMSSSASTGRIRHAHATPAGQDWAWPLRKPSARRMELKSRFPAKKATAVVSQWSCRSWMFLKMSWRSQHFEPTDSEHNFILLSERFNLTRVILSMYVIASTEPYRVSESAKSCRNG